MDTSADADAIRKSAEAHYQGGNLIWNPADPWNGHKRQCIDEFVTTSCGAILNSAQTVLNAGSGGEPYGWRPLVHFSDRIIASTHGGANQ